MDEHPWGAFLDARYRAMVWLRDDGKSDEEIETILSMSPGQARAIFIAAPGRLTGVNTKTRGAE